jgi:hypothetical protein
MQKSQERADVTGRRANMDFGSRCGRIAELVSEYLAEVTCGERMREKERDPDSTLPTCPCNGMELLV